MFSANSAVGQDRDGVWVGFNTMDVTYRGAIFTNTNSGTNNHAEVYTGGTLYNRSSTAFDDGHFHTVTVYGGNLYNHSNPSIRIAIGTANIYGGTMTNTGTTNMFARKIGTANIFGGTLNHHNGRIITANVYDGTLNVDSSSCSIDSVTIDGGVLNHIRTHVDMSINTATINSGILNNSSRIRSATMNGGTVNNGGTIDNLTTEKAPVGSIRLTLTVIQLVGSLALDHIVTLTGEALER
jgi:hypothetical protein